MIIEGRSRAEDASASRKLGLSCAECRRSKLKCDRTFPCQSCIRRGCAGICPDGALNATKGNKVLIAHAQRLSEQVKTLTSRVRELETALSAMSDPGLLTHAVCVQALPSCAATNVAKGMGSLSIDPMGERETSDTCTPNVPSTPSLEDETFTALGSDLQEGVSELVKTFPLGMKGCRFQKTIFLEYLPTKEKVLEILSLHYRHATWMYDPVGAGELAQFMKPIYEEDCPSLESLHPHQISVFFSLLATGSLAESRASSTTISRQYHSLAQAAFSMVPISNEVDIATIQALFLIIRYLFHTDRSSIEERWILTGITIRLAQRLGLHRDPPTWNSSPEEVQKKRRVFWELYSWEIYGSLICGRPPSLTTLNTDCLFPDDVEAVLNSNGVKELSWNAWKLRYAAVCGTASAAHVFGSTPPEYSILLELDKRIREFPIPEYLRAPSQNLGCRLSWSQAPITAIQQYIVLSVKSANLLYIHRIPFSKAIHEMPKDPLQHKYAPSVLTVVQCARRLIAGLHGVHTCFDHHFVWYSWYFWSTVYFACVMLGALVTESPGCTLSSQALHDLENFLPLYEQNTLHLEAQDSVHALELLYSRAVAAFKTYQEHRSLHRTESRPRSNPEVPHGQTPTSGLQKPESHTATTSTTTTNSLVNFYSGPSQYPPSVNTVDLTVPDNQSGGQFDGVVDRL